MSEIQPQTVPVLNEQGYWMYNGIQLGKSNDPVVVHDYEEWRYEEAPRGVKVQLLTLGDVAVYGEWKGSLGEFFKAWHPVPRRNKKKEAELGL